MNRYAASTFLTAEYAELASEGKIDATQTSIAYAAAIDMSLRQLGYAETDLSTADVDQANVLNYIALLHYYALKRFKRLLSIKYDVKLASNAIDAARSQIFRAVSSMLDDAEQELLSLGISLQGTGFEMGRINLDYNEPGFTGDLAGLDSFWWF